MLRHSSGKYFPHLIIILLSVLFYGTSLQNDFALDDRFIFENIPPKDAPASDIFKVFSQRFVREDYRPVAYFTYAVEQMVVGEIKPIVSHSINLFLYIAVIILLYSTISLLPVAHSTSIALAAAVLFLAHPAHAGVVNNLKSRDGLFSMLFLLGALKAFLIYEQHKRWYLILAGAMLFLLGVFSKLDALNLIFILPILLLLLYKKDWKWTLLSGYLIFMCYIIFRVVLLDKIVPPDKLALTQAVLFTENPLPYDHTLVNKLGMAVATYWQYLLFMLIPKGYYFYFGFDMIPLQPVYHPIILLKAAVLLAILGGSIWYYKKNKLVTAGMLIFFTALFYCSNLYTPVGGIVADRYAFIASMGFLLAISALIADMTARYQLAEKIKTRFNKPFITSNSVALMITGLLVMVYFPYVQQRNAAWKDTLTLFETDLPHLKKSFEANRIASTTYVQRAMSSKQAEEKEYLFSKGLQYAKQANIVYKESIFTHESEAIAYYGLNNIPEAEQKFKAIISQFDSSTVSWDLLGDITFRRGNFDSAAYCYKNVIRTDSNNVSAYYKLPSAYYSAGQKDSAFSFLNTVMQRYPYSYVPHESISYLYFNEGDTLQGLNHLVTAFEKGFRDPYMYNITKELLLRKNQPDKAKLLDAIVSAK